MFVGELSLSEFVLDGRQFDKFGPLSSKLGFLPRAHGSSLFTRGVTQGMNIVTLGKSA